MAVKVTPFCDVTKLTRHQDGNIIDYGHCLSENPSEQILNQDYTFSGFIQERNTQTMIVKPYFQLNTGNGIEFWDYSGAYFAEVYPSGYNGGGGRSLMKWKNTDPEIFYWLSSPAFDAYQPLILELGVLPLKETSITPYIRIIYGCNVSMVVYKDKSPEIFFLVDGDWKFIGVAELQFKYLWKDIGTDHIWFIPYMDGILISTNGTDFQFFRSYTPLTFEKSGISIMSTGGVAAYGVHFVQYDLAPFIISDTKEMFNIPTQEPNILVRGHTIGGTLVNDIVMVSDTSYQYRVIAYPGNTQIGIYTVSVNFPPQLSVTSAAELTVYDVEEVNESIPEDPSDETCSIVLRNSALQHSGEFKRFDDVEWYFGWVLSDGSLYPSVPITRNVGKVIELRDVQGVGGDRTIELECVSPLYKVKNGTVVFTPDYAGWLVEDMLADFLLRMGIPEDKQSIYQWGIPLLEEQDRTFIKPEYGSSAWQWIEDVVYDMLGGWIYCQRDGTVRIEPYPEVEDANLSLAIPLSANDCDSISYDNPENSLENFRNFVRVIGKDSYGVWRIADAIDEASIYDPTSSNYTGYMIPFIYSIPFPTTQEWNQYVCQNLFSVLNKQRWSVTIDTGKMVGSTDIYPGSILRIDYPTKVSDYVLVRSLSSRIAHSNFQQSIVGHWIPT